jgi:NTE family protein
MQAGRPENPGKVYPVPTGGHTLMGESPHSENHPRLRKIDKTTLLSQCQLFSGLSRWELIWLGHLARLVEYKKDEMVFSAGDAAESFYVIVSGRFEAFVWRNDKKKILAYFKRGDHFGEIAILTETPHSATLCALSDSLLLKFKKEDFKKILEQKAKVAFALSRRLGLKLKTSDPHSESLSKSEIIAILDANRPSGPGAFCVNLAASLVKEGREKTVLIEVGLEGSQPERKAQDPKPLFLNQTQGILHERPEELDRFLVSFPGGFDVLKVCIPERDPEAEGLLVRLINHFAAGYCFVLLNFFAVPDEGPLVKTLKHSDQIFFVTDSELDALAKTKERLEALDVRCTFGKFRAAVVIEEALLGIHAQSALRRSFFKGRRCFTVPEPSEFINQTLADFPQPFRPLVLDEPEGDYAKAVRYVARFVSHSLVGLALGSGAALGLAHIGVLKVLEREKIPVDVVAGSSIGALIGGLYAIGKSASEIEHDMLRELGGRWRAGRIFDLTLFPVRGFCHGNTARGIIKRFYGDKTFENCQIPLRIVAANLSTCEVVTYESGFLAEAVRASIAIPAIFKPVISADGVVVDGGILSPLPIHALERAGASKIIAVNVFPDAGDAWQRRILREAAEEKQWAMLAHTNIFRRFFYRLKKKITQYFYPNVVDILMNTIQSMESAISEIEGEKADILIRPVIPEASWMEFYKPMQFIKKGEEETEKLLPQIKEFIFESNP